LALLALGSARARYHLRQCFVYLDMPVVNQPEVMIAKAAEEFDAHGHLTDDKAKELIGRLLANLCELASRRRPGKLPASFHAPRPGPRRVQLNLDRALGPGRSHETRVVERRCRPRNGVSRLIRAGAPSA
jgi:hypothetical protein